MADDRDLIAAIYDAAIDHASWDEVVKRIVEATQSIAGGILIEQLGSPHLSALCNVDPFYADLNVIQIDYRRNPLVADAATIAPGEVRGGSYITQTDSFKLRCFTMNISARRDGRMSSLLAFFVSQKHSGT